MAEQTLTLESGDASALPSILSYWVDGRPVEVLPGHLTPDFPGDT